MKQPAPVPTGYIALISVVLVMSAVVIVGLMITLLAANSTLTTYTFDRGQRALAVADSCANEVMLRVKRVGIAYIGTHSISLDSDRQCTMVVSDAGDNTINATITGVWRNQTSSTITLQLQTSPFSVSNWHEGQ